MASLPLRALPALLPLVSRAVSNPQAFTATTSTTFPTTPLTTSSTAAPASSSTPIACNNSPDLCTRAYNDILHMGAHDSAFVRDASTGYSISGNQYYNATVALSAGIRLLQAQVHLSDDKSTLVLCHTDCRLMYAGPLETWLTRIKTWLDANPHDVITLLLVNSDNQPASSFGDAFNRSGIANYAWTPPSSSSSSVTWPTLQTLITSNTRVITFLAPLTLPSPSPSSTQYPPYLLDEFTHLFETPYNATAPNPNFTCALDRPASASSASRALDSGLLPLVNHFAYRALTEDVMIPDAGDVDRTNNPDEGVVGGFGRHVRDLYWGVDGG